MKTSKHGFKIGQRVDGLLMIRKKCNNIEWLEFELLTDFPNLQHGVFLRHGGQSEGSFNSLNSCYGLGDNPEHVSHNLKSIQDILSLASMKWVYQVHGNDICLVDEKSASENRNYDALATSALDTILLIKHADCQAALFYDPVNQVIANVHSGWRGSVKNIYRETLRTLQAKFGSNPADILVGISPSLGPEHAEFIHYKQEFPEEFWEFQVKPNYFDFWAISEWQLTQVGVLPHHIEVARECTFANSKDYFSYRRDKIMGCHATCIGLKGF